MSYTKRFEVLSTDCAPNSLARPAKILGYLQEAAVHQMLTERPTYRELFDDNKAFLLSRITLRLYLPLCEYETFTVETGPYNDRGATFGRSYRLMRGGDLVAEAMAAWALVDTADKTLYRTDDVSIRYTAGPDTELSARCAFPKVLLESVATRRVEFEDIDCNGHLNNCRYPDWLCNTIPDIDRRRVTALNIHYVSEAPLGETVTILQGTADDGNTFVFETRRGDGNVNVRAVIHTEPWKP